MTPKDHAEQLIRERVPELQELSLGCEVVTKIPVGNDLYNTRVLDLVDDVLWLDGGRSLVKSTKSVIKEIIGHPIHLEHVLLAIKKSGNYYVHVTKDGDIVVPHYYDPDGQSPSGVDDCIEFYDLTQPFHNQSPELHQLVINLLEK